MFSEINLVSLEKSGFLYLRKKLTLVIRFKLIQMKLILLLTSLTLFFFTATCNNQTSNDKSMDAATSIEVEGKIEAIGMTSWQYGTHTLTNDENFYALRSKTVK